MPTVSETNVAYIPRFHPYHTGGDEVPMIQELDPVTMKPKLPNEVEVDVNALDQVATASSASKTKKIFLVAGLAIAAVILIVVPVAVTQTINKTTSTALSTTTVIATTRTTATTTTVTTATTTTVTTATTTSATTSTTTSATTSTSTSSTTSKTTSTTSTTTSTTTTTTTRAPQYMQLTGVNDTMVGIYNTAAGQSSGSSIGSYSAPEDPPAAFDNNINTKYLNYGNGGYSNTVGVNTGYYITPAVGLSCATGISFATANDHPDRDPTSITLEGSNSASAQLPLGSSWSLLYNGSTGISSTVDPGRQVYVSIQNFTNNVTYTSYRLLVTAQRGSDNSVQYAEANLFGIA